MNLDATVLLGAGARRDLRRTGMALCPRTASRRVLWPTGRPARPHPQPRISPPTRPPPERHRRHRSAARPDRRPRMAVELGPFRHPLGLGGGSDPRQPPPRPAQPLASRPRRRGRPRNSTVSPPAAARSPTSSAATPRASMNMPSSAPPSSPRREFFRRRRGPRFLVRRTRFPRHRRLQGDQHRRQHDRPPHPPPRGFGWAAARLDDLVNLPPPASPPSSSSSAGCLHPEAESARAACPSPPGRSCAGTQPATAPPTPAGKKPPSPAPSASPSPAPAATGLVVDDEWMGKAAAGKPPRKTSAGRSVFCSVLALFRRRLSRAWLC